MTEVARGGGSSIVLRDSCVLAPAVAAAVVVVESRYGLPAAVDAGGVRSTALLQEVRFVVVVAAEAEAAVVFDTLAVG